MPLTLHNRTGAILMNLFFGLGGSLIYGLTSQLTSYVRMLATGVSYGLDAVSTRLSSTESDKAIQNMCYHMTRLTSCIALPAAGGLFILAEPILTYWVGSQMSDPDTQLPLTATLIRIMCAGMVVRSLTDVWINILYGAGYVSKYAFLILGGAIANPIVAITLYFILPEPIRFTFAVWAYTIVFVMANLGLLPRLMGRLLQMNTYEILAPIIKPLMVTLVSMLTLWYAISFFDASSIPLLFSMCAGYGILYTVLTSIFVLRPDERRLAVTLLKRVLPR
jgi:O-antigen/teichoic acid export membrane protein